MVNNFGATRSKHATRRGTWLARCATALAGVALVSTVLAGGASAAIARKSAPSATAQITSNWVAFFSGKSSATKKLSLLEDASAFKSVVDAQAGSALGKGASATVNKVTVSGTKATVRYTIDLDGTPALRNEVGASVKIDGSWKVASVSFCHLLALEQVKAPACTATT
jgi:hypothetical protein